MQASFQLTAVKTMFSFLIANLMSDVGHAIQPLWTTVIHFNLLVTKYLPKKPILTFIEVAKRETSKIYYMSINDESWREK